MIKHLVQRTALLAVGALVATGAGLGTATAGAADAQERAGDRSLAKVLAADGTRLDRNWQDFDILEQAVLAVIDAKPHSPVALLADGSVRLTAFAPTDMAFRHLVGDLTGKRPGTEKRTLKKLLQVADVDTVETVLLYHVVAGATLTSPKVVPAARAGTKLETAQGGTVKVVERRRGITLVDKDRDLRDATVVLEGIDINRGNKQVAHAIDRVLLPVDL